MTTQTSYPKISPGHFCKAFFIVSFAALLLTASGAGAEAEDFTFGISYSSPQAITIGYPGYHGDTSTVLHVSVGYRGGHHGYFGTHRSWSGRHYGHYGKHFRHFRGDYGHYGKHYRYFDRDGGPHFKGHYKHFRHDRHFDRHDRRFDRRHRW